MAREETAHKDSEIGETEKILLKPDKETYVKNIQKDLNLRYIRRKLEHG